MASGPVGQVLAGRSSGDVRVRVADLAGAAAVLERAGLRVAPADGALRVGGVTDPADLTRLLAGHGHWVAELAPVAVDLEEAFLALTGTPAAAPPGQAA